MRSADNITLNRLLTAVARQGASDLHLTIGSPPVIRKDGNLLQLESEEILTVNFLGRVIETVLQEKGRDKLEKRGEVLLTQTFNKSMRFRVHIYKQKGYYSLAFRYIPAFNKTIVDIGLPTYLEKSVRFKQGLVVVTGIYDSGKSTTLTAILNTLNTAGPSRYINTLERPIENLFSNNRCIIEQREIGRDVASYTQGLKLVLGGDIDMVVLDRIEDAKTTKKVLEALEAGRSAVVTIHASSSVGAIAKILQFFDRGDIQWARDVLAKHLLCIVAQKLVSKIGGGRVLVYEFLPNLDLVTSFIAGNHLDRIDSVLKNERGNDATSLEKSLASRVQKGEVKLEQALTEANDKDYLETLLR